MKNGTEEIQTYQQNWQKIISRKRKEANWHSNIDRQGDGAYDVGQRWKGPRIQINKS
jgi:hypothetical protein